MLLKNLNKSIYLCGFMGCGKSTIGKNLAKKLEFDFVDMDDYIVEKLGMSIPDIFSQKGEQFFRDAETETIKELSSGNSIIACGGGAMLKKINSEIANQNGIVVYIDVPFDTCYERIKDDSNRPLVQNNTKDSLHNIYSGRVPVYIEHSFLIVDGVGTPEEIADRIVFEIIK